MISRVDDFNILSSESFDKIAKVVYNNESKKLYKICNSNEEAVIATNELKLEGFKCAIDKVGNIINVYRIIPERVELKQAELDGGFKKLAWGRYCFQRQNSINGLTDYNFDDGSIWRLVTGDDGKEYLVKDVDDADDNKVVRKKVASMEKKANKYTTDSNIKNTLQIIYNDSSIGNSAFVSDLILSPIKDSLYSLLDEKINELIDEKLQQQAIMESTTIDNVKNFIAENITSNNIVDNASFNSYMDSRIKDIQEAMEIL